MENEQIFSTPAATLTVTEQAQFYLNIIRKWTKFFFILGFIFNGLGIIVSLIMLAISLIGANGVVGLASIPYLLITVIYFFPVYYLYKFHENLEGALQTKSAMSLEKAFHNLKKNFQYVGIMLIIAMAVYPIIFIVLLTQIRGGGLPGM